MSKEILSLILYFVCFCLNVISAILDKKMDRTGSFFWDGMTVGMWLVLILVAIDRIISA